ncbi:amidohydrolase family protein [Telmatospirillum sp.]|uniref:amidohydrolase family protein n=1 Tax=Telmatospirillum sp. TaxID=2079197 RepID=UPI00284BF096|nr:amidohydrolase family protein [Telmatospirillum sp.]MDR3439412.1 amidohydrolase family protein [Telmatospirillum sp.]
MSDELIIGPDRTGRVVSLRDGLVVAGLPDATLRLACPEGEILPGAVCAHTHIYSGLVPYGMPAPAEAPQNFLQILRRIWWRLDRALDADTLRAAAEDYVAKALLAGTTTLIDHHESPSLIAGSLAILAEVCERLGMRALLCYGATERNFGADEAGRGLAECESLVDTSLVRGLIGLHAGFTVSDETIRAAGELARQRKTVLHVHVAEDNADVADARARGYRGPLERLRSLDALVPGSILAHGVHLGADEIHAANAADCWLIHNPRSNEGNRVGYAKVLGGGRRVALGTDGWNADMAEEQAALDRLGRQNDDKTIGGRLAAGQRLVAERFGAATAALAPGALADLVIRQNGRVRHVLVGGRLVIADGGLVTGSMEEIAETARKQADRLWKRMEAL